MIVMAVTTLTGTDARLVLSDVWNIGVRVRDADGNAGTAPVVTITLPGGSTATPDIVDLGGGDYRALYTVGTAGRYVARAVATGYGAADFAAWVTSTTAATSMPTIQDLRGPDPRGDDPDDLGYLGQTSATDTEIQGALDAEADAQRRKCVVAADYPPALREALLRRVARNLAMRGLPTAVLQGDAETGGTVVLPGRDPEVQRLEAGFRRLPMG